MKASRESMRHYTENLSLVKGNTFAARPVEPMDENTILYLAPKSSPSELQSENKLSQKTQDTQQSQQSDILHRQQLNIDILNGVSPAKLPPPTYFLQRRTKSRSKRNIQSPFATTDPHKNPSSPIGVRGIKELRKQARKHEAGVLRQVHNGFQVHRAGSFSRKPVWKPVMSSAAKIQKSAKGSSVKLQHPSPKHQQKSDKIDTTNFQLRRLGTLQLFQADLSESLHLQNNVLDNIRHSPRYKSPFSSPATLPLKEHEIGLSTTKLENSKGSPRDTDNLRKKSQVSFGAHRAKSVSKLGEVSLSAARLQGLTAETRPVSAASTYPKVSKSLRNAKHRYISDDMARRQQLSSRQRTERKQLETISISSSKKKTDRRPKKSKQSVVAASKVYLRQRPAQQRVKSFVPVSKMAKPRQWTAPQKNDRLADNGLLNGLFGQRGITNVTPDSDISFTSRYWFSRFTGR